MGRSALLCVLVLAACSHERRVTRQRCEQLRDHLVDLRLQQVGPNRPGHPPIDLTAHRRALQRALGEGFLTRCQQQIALAKLDCEFDAKDATTANACGSQQ